MGRERGEERQLRSAKASRKSAKPARRRPRSGEGLRTVASSGTPTAGAGGAVPVNVGVGCGPLLRGQRVVASVMFADLRGLTNLAARLPSQRVVALLDDFLSAMTDVAVGYRAAIHRLMGDAIVLLFGVPVSRVDDPVRAVRSALDMQHAFLSLRNRWLQDGRREAGRLGLRVGIATGNVVLAAVGLGERSDTTVVGETWSRAGALCGAAQRADVLIDQETYERAASRLDSQVVFTSAELDGKFPAGGSAYRCQMRRSGLHIVPLAAHTDPVCRIDVNPRGALRRPVNGRVYYFCSRSCAERFVRDPAAFVDK